MFLSLGEPKSGRLIIFWDTAAAKYSVANTSGFVEGCMEHRLLLCWMVDLVVDHSDGAKDVHRRIGVLYPRNYRSSVRSANRQNLKFF